MIAAAGTGGHIYPGMAIADFFQAKGFSISWLGTPLGMENILLNKKKIQFFPLSISGIRGRGLVGWIYAPFLVIIALYQAAKAIKYSNPVIIILMGGYVCMPAALAAKLLNIKFIIHEQNAIPGLTNKILSKIANKAFCAFPNSLNKATVIGNPIRNKIYNISKPNVRFLNRKGPLRILVIGGSLGARIFNDVFPELFNSLNRRKKISIVHQSGINHFDELLKSYEKVNFPVKVEKFIHDIQDQYEWADIVIARAGALTVSEFSQAGIASILIPYSFAVDNHQYFNAKILEEKKGAIIIEQSKLKDEIIHILIKINRALCLSMALKAKNKLKHKPCSVIFEYCQQII